MFKKLWFPLVFIVLLGGGIYRLYRSDALVQTDSPSSIEKMVVTDKFKSGGDLFVSPSQYTGTMTKTAKAVDECDDSMPPPGIALNMAVAMDDYETVSEMIATGVDVNLRTEDSVAQTALMAAASSRMTAMLLKAGADPRLADMQGTSVLHHVVLKDEALSIIPLLVNAGADPNAVEPTNGETPLLWAKQWFFGLDPKMGFKVLDLLVNNGAGVDAKDNAGNTLVHIAVMNRKQQLVKFLVDKGADVSLANADGRTPLETARDLDFREMVKILSKGGD